MLWGEYVSQRNLQDPNLKAELDQRKEFESQKKAGKEFSDKMRTGLPHTGPMPGDAGSMMDDDDKGEDEIAIQELEKSMAKGLKNKRKARVKAKIKASAKRAAKRIKIIKAPKPPAADPTGPFAGEDGPALPEGHPVGAGVPGVAFAPRASAEDRAGPGDNQVYLNGRLFSRLQHGGLSLQCQYHRRCTKHISFGINRELDEEECKRRLLAWESDCVPGDIASAHIKRGKPLLRNDAVSAHKFA